MAHRTSVSCTSCAPLDKPTGPCAWTRTTTVGGAYSFFLIHRFHSISFTRAQAIPKYKIGFGREKDGRVGESLVEGGGGHGAPGCDGTTKLGRYVGHWSVQKLGVGGSEFTRCPVKPMVCNHCEGWGGGGLFLVLWAPSPHFGVSSCPCHFSALPSRPPLCASVGGWLVSL